MVRLAQNDSMKQMRNLWIYRFRIVVTLTLLMVAVACSSSSQPEATKDDNPKAFACAPDAEDAPLDFTLKDMDDNDVTLASFKGKVILVNFWATWCAPCKAEIPAFVELQEQYSDDLQILGISVDDTVEDMRPYAAEFKVNYPFLVGLGRQDVEDAYGPLFGIPQSFVISRDGKICKKHAGIASKQQFEEEIKGLL